MAKKAAFTGTGKKANKAVAKAQKYAAERYVKEAPRKRQQVKGAEHRIKEIGKGKHIPEYKAKTKYEPTKVEQKAKYEPKKFKPETKYEAPKIKTKAEYEPSKFKPEAEYQPSKFKPETEYQHKTLSQLQKDYARAGEGLEPLFAQRQKAALSNFYSNVAPGINTELGSGSKSSSALNQAIAAARGNLAQNLSSDFESMRNQVAGNLLGQREQQRQFGAQFGQGQEEFYNQLKNQQQQFGAQFGAGREDLYKQLKNQQQQFGAQFGAGREDVYNQLKNQQRQFGAEFGGGQERYAAGLGAQQEQYGAAFRAEQEALKNQMRNQQGQFGAQFGLAQEKERQAAGVQGLNARLQANAGIAGQGPIMPQFAQLPHPYLQAGQKGPGMGAAIAAGILKGAGGEGGGVVPALAQAMFQQRAAGAAAQPAAFAAMA